jgi:hypothetical protein
VALSIAQHGEQDSRPSPGQGDRGLVVPPALTPLALLEGAGTRSAQAGEGGLVEDPLEADRAVRTKNRRPAATDIGKYKEGHHRRKR